ncbi:MAG TPA: pilus assembly protein PilM [Deltaproteobacteria bacterium]|nr:pilus assembly protein PilM [Deltaproteobacteria bacterium]HPR54616.1 pilus assembly protein PilM [Deltaproteobacteria bacterium]HXK47252.1 pilus assembly protein PilM [Deltaproteobacteria bacterium]
MRTVITRRSLGISWDERRVQACLVRAGIAEFVIEGLMIVPRELDASGNPVHGPAEDLRHVVDRMGSDAEICVSALPEAEIMYRTLTRPFPDRRKIMETIGPEVETLLPALDARLLVDFVLTGKNPEGAYVIQALCSRATSVLQTVDVMKAAGLDPEIVDCPAVAVASGARILFDLPQDKDVVVLHMGWSETSLAVLTGKTLRYVGALPYGIERIVSDRHVDGAQAETVDMERMRTHGVNGGEALPGLLREVLIMLDRSGASGGEQVLLASGYARYIKEFEKTAEDVLGVGTLTPPLHEIQFEGDMDDLTDGLLSVSLACRGIEGADAVNFRQGEIGLTKRFRKVMGDAGPWIKAAVVLLVIWIAGLGLDVSLKSRTNAMLTKRINAEFSSVMPKGTPMVDPVKQMEQYQARLSGQTGALGGAAAGSMIDVLKDLSAAIPTDVDVVLDTVNIDGESITVSGSTGKYEDVERIQGALAKVPYIKEVKIVSANVDKNDQKVKMKLICKR